MMCSMSSIKYMMPWSQKKLGRSRAAKLSPTLMTRRMTQLSFKVEIEDGADHSNAKS
jgi:hypothetical protein